MNTTNAMPLMEAVDARGDLANVRSWRRDPVAHAAARAADERRLQEADGVL